MSDIIAKVKNFKRYYRWANLRAHLQGPAEDLIALYAAGIIQTNYQPSAYAALSHFLVLPLAASAQALQITTWVRSDECSACHRS